MIADHVNAKTGVVYFKVLVKPLVNLIWVAGIVFVLGSLRRALARRPRAAAARRRGSRPRGRDRRRARARRAARGRRGRPRRAAVPARAGGRRRPARCADAPSERRLALVEERDRALAALKELEFDHRTGKIGDEDYRAARRPAAPRGRCGAAGARPGAALRFGDELREPESSPSRARRPTRAHFPARSSCRSPRRRPTRGLRRVSRRFRSPARRSRPGGGESSAMRRLALALLVLLVVATPAFGDDVTKKHQVDWKISSLQGRLAQQKRNEQALRSEVADFTSRIRSLEDEVGDVSLRLKTLEADLALHQRRLDALNALFRSRRALHLPPGAVQVVGRDAPAAPRRRSTSRTTASTLDVVLGARNVAGRARRGRST